MFLTHGLNEHDELMPVEAVPSGRTSLTCPYCGQGLIARKGRILAWHFAHDGETCRDVAQNNDRITVPFYDKFDLGLSKRLFETLTAVHGGSNFIIPQAQTLERLEFVKYNSFARNGRGDWEMTHKGRIPFGSATLTAFAQVQRETVASKHDRLLYSVEMAAKYDHLDYKTAVTDLRLYRAQLARLLTTSLYLMEITTGDGSKLYKIGVTGRSAEERAAEVQSMLRPYLEQAKVKPLRVLTGRGSVERYALHRWHEYHHPIGRLTEFFQLEDRRQLLSDFTRLGDLEPNELESGIIAGQIMIPAEGERL